MVTCSDAGTDAAEHVLTGLALKNDSLDASLVQQLAEQQTGRSRADDRNLGSRWGRHEYLLCALNRGWLK